MGLFSFFKRKKGSGNTEHDVNYWYNAAVSHGAKGELNEAVRCFEKVVQLDPNEPLSWYYKGLTEERAGLDSLALKSYRRFIQLRMSKFPKEGEDAERRLKTLEQSSGSVSPVTKRIALDNRKPEPETKIPDVSKEKVSNTPVHEDKNSPANLSVVKIPCIRCGAKILPETAKKYDGLCVACATGARSSIPIRESLRTEGFVPNNCFICGRAIRDTEKRTKFQCEKCGFTGNAHDSCIRTPETSNGNPIGASRIFVNNLCPKCKTEFSRHGHQNPSDEYSFDKHLNANLKFIDTLGEPYRSFVQTYFHEEILSMLGSAARTKMALTRADLKEHSFAVSEGPLSYWICTLPSSIADAKKWFKTAYGGYSKLIERAWNSDSFLSGCEVLVHIVYGKTMNNEWVRATIFPVRSDRFGIKPIIAVDLLNDIERNELERDELLKNTTTLSDVSDQSRASFHNDDILGPLMDEKLNTKEGRHQFAQAVSKGRGDYAIASGVTVFIIWFRTPWSEMGGSEEVAMQLVLLGDKGKLPNWLTGSEASANVLLGNYEVETFQDVFGCLVSLRKP